MFHVLAVTLSAVFVLFVLCASLYVTSFAIFGLRRDPRVVRRAANTRFLVLVPAHNQGSGIETTLFSLRQADYPPELMRLAVIADNCTDNTAEVARACGFEVWTRNDPENHGKGQALSWAFDKAALAFDLAAVIDANTWVDPDFFAAMDSAYAGQLQKGRSCVALQGRYLLERGGESATWFEQFTLASKAAENSFSYRPRSALGLTNLIQGNGFCISHSALEQVPFTATSIVEDSEYAVTLAFNGIQVVYVDDARVISRITKGLKDAAPQRVRWAGGTFDLFAHSLPGLLRSAITQRKWRLAETALMLALTSRLLLIYATVLSVALLDLAYPFRHFDLAAWALAASVALQSMYLYLVLRRADYTPVPLHTIAFIPFYVGFLWAMQVGAALGFGKRQWSRTAR